MEDQPKASFTEADLGILLAASQNTLRLLYGRAQGLPPDFNSAEGGMLDTTVTALPGGGLSSLLVEVHLVPSIDSESGMRHGMTLQLAGIQNTEEDSATLPTGIFDIWWTNSPKFEGGAYYELRDNGGGICDEATAQMLLDQLPDPVVHEGQTRPNSGLQSGTITQLFGALGIREL